MGLCCLREAAASTLSATIQRCDSATCAGQKGFFTHCTAEIWGGGLHGWGPPAHFRMLRSTPLMPLGPPVWQPKMSLDLANVPREAKSPRVENC